MKLNSTRSIIEKIRELIGDTVSELGYTLWDVEYVKEGINMVLRLTIDSSKGIGIQDCEKVHRAVNVIIDEVDPIEGAYNLEVSSPGIERDLKSEMHFAAAIGVKVEVKLYAAHNGEKSFVGELTEFDEKTLTITRGEEVITFTFEEISKVRTVYDFTKINMKAPIVFEDEESSSDEDASDEDLEIIEDDEVEEQDGEGFSHLENIAEINAIVKKGSKTRG